MVCNGYVAGRIAASRGLATFSNLEMQHSPKIFCIFLQKVLAKNRLADCPVIAVPTSVGYGASFGGLSALLSMLNSCASGVSVVNIDNGFGAGYLASMINHMEAK
ncbi:hypothetical protein CLOSCI_02774 [[Clostridium] scindens ATCC 35704]|nr:hypothetical protein CLOSCI_02774 [[Clostridium] scindens ATCC 35704]BDF16201.1 hypothetical protein CE91St59_14640 [[Clostridium] scindens]BDF19898.1 hypothetical protein CE91St60_14810 [[Clostridium] scindens]